MRQLALSPPSFSYSQHDGDGVAEGSDIIPPPPPEEEEIPPPPPEEEQACVPPPPQRLQGKVVSFNAKKGFGFLRPEAWDDDNDGDLFVHKKSVMVEGSGAATFSLTEGEAVSFIVSGQEGKPCAVDVRTPSGGAFVLESKQKLDLRWHAESWRGLKDEQQDRYTCGEDLGDLGTYFGVFDGHGGIFTSEWLAKNLHRSIVSWRDTMPRSWHPNEAGARDLLTKVFQLSDKELIKLPGHAKTRCPRRRLPRTPPSPKRGHFAAVLALSRLASRLLTPGECMLRDGSTALIAMISGETPPGEGVLGDVKLLVANCGDCRGVLCRGGYGVAMSVDHKPNRYVASKQTVPS